MIIVNIKRLKDIHNQIIINSKGYTQKSPNIAVSYQDLEVWRKVFETAQEDSELTITSPPGLDIRITRISDK